MSGNFWKSSHFQQWLLDPQEIMIVRIKDLQQNNLKEDEYYKLMIFFSNFIQTLGEQLRLRQQVIASATVYFRRFYSKYSLKCIDPFLLAPTCLFLATKVEEFGLQSQQRFSSQTASLIKGKYSYLYPHEYPYKIQHIWECEFFLLEVMDCCLILYHPYRPLIQFLSDFCPDDTQLLQVAWRVANDTLRTDISLMYPPSLTALACLHVACVVQRKDCKQWLSELNVDMEKIFEIVRHILYLYDIYKTYDEKDQIKDILSRVPKPRLSTSSRSSSQQPSDHSNQVQNTNINNQIKNNAMPNNPTNNNNKNVNNPGQIMNNQHNMNN